MTLGLLARKRNVRHTGTVLRFRVGTHVMQGRFSGSRAARSALSKASLAGGFAQDVRRGVGFGSVLKLRVCLAVASGLAADRERAVASGLAPVHTLLRGKVFRYIRARVANRPGQSPPAVHRSSRSSSVLSGRGFAPRPVTEDYGACTSSSSSKLKEETPAELLKREELGEGGL